MKVSIIIPAYNEEKTIGDCLDSLRVQSFKDFEVIVVDDGSFDLTQDIVRKKSIQLNCRLLIQQHKGAGAARNLGVKNCHGEILVFIDADMTFDKDFIAKLIKPIVDGGVIGTFSKEEFLANSNNSWAVCWNISRGLPRDKMHPANYPNYQKVFRAIRKDVFEKAGGFDEKAGYTDDWSLSEKLGIEAQAAPGAIFFHRNPDSLKEVFIQSRWLAKRKYKYGLLGLIAALVRAFVIFSIPKAFYLFLKHGNIAIFPFKLVSDAGIFIGILEFGIFGRYSK